MIENEKFLDVMKPLRAAHTASPNEATYAAAWAHRCAPAESTTLLLTSIADAANRRPAHGEIWIWFGAACEQLTDDPAALTKILDRDTQLRLKKLKRKQDRASVATAHASARLLLGTMLDHPPDALRFERGPHGKPYLAWPPQDGVENLHFNISHTDGAVAVALSCTPVGIDIELQRSMDDLMSLAKMMFATEAVNDLNKAASDSARRTLFYRYWTLGEALIKATGQGLEHNLKSFAFTPVGEPKLRRADKEFGGTGEWTFGVFGVGC